MARTPEDVVYLYEQSKSLREESRALREHCRVLREACGALREDSRSARAFAHQLVKQTREDPFVHCAQQVTTV
jgi:hypothetical protein